MCTEIFSSGFLYLIFIIISFGGKSLEGRSGNCLQIG